MTEGGEPDLASLDIKAGGPDWRPEGMDGMINHQGERLGRLTPYGEALLVEMANLPILFVDEATGEPRVVSFDELVQQGLIQAPEPNTSFGPELPEAAA